MKASVYKWGRSGLLLLFFVGCAHLLFAQDSQSNKWKNAIDFNGYVKYLHSASFTDIDQLYTQNLLHNRLNLKVYLPANFSVAIEARNRLFYGETVKLNPLFSEQLQDPGTVDLGWLVGSSQSTALYAMIDRAYVEWASNNWDIRLGRQRINWGISMIWNTNDLFNAYNFTDFDYEERPGSDALRVQYYTSGMSSVELAVAPGKEFSETVAAVMYKFNKWQYDFQILTGIYHENYVIGSGWAGNLKKVGFKGEAAFFYPYVKGNNREKATFNLSVSADYLFPNSIYVNTGFLLQTEDQDLSAEEAGRQFLNANLSARRLMPSQFSVFGQVSGQITPLFTADLSLIYGTGSDFILAMPSLSYGLAENWDLSLVGQLFFSEQSQGRIDNSGNALFMRMKWSF